MSGENSNKVEPRRSSWALFFLILGIFLLVVSFLCLFFYFAALPQYKHPSQINFGIFGLVIGLQSLLFGFLINVFTDIRWYLAKIANRDS